MCTSEWSAPQSAPQSARSFQKKEFVHHSSINLTDISISLTRVYIIIQQ